MSNLHTFDMNLIIPGIGTEPGPDWAEDLNASLNIIDGHDHSPGNGVAITPDGMNITGDLAINSNNLTTVRSLRLSAISLGSVTASDVGCLIESGVDLYYVDGNGNQVRITNGGSVAGATGSISGLTSPASASFSTDTFTFQSDSNVAANLDVASIIVRKTSASSAGITISAPTALASSYTMTLLATAPAATNALFMDSSGNVSAPTNPTFLGNITVNGSVTVGAAGPALSNNTGILTSSAVSFQPGGVLNGTLQGLNALDTLYVAKSDGTLPYPLVVSANPTSHGLKIVRGYIASSGAINSGEGFTVGKVGSAYTITFTIAFSETPAVVASPVSNVITCGANPLGPSSALITLGSASDFSFVAIGQRA